MKYAYVTARKSDISVHVDTIEPPTAENHRDPS